MSLKFHKTQFTALDAIPEDLRALDLYPKVTDMMNFIVRKYAEEFEDISLKHKGPNVVREEVVKNIITELGFDYITSVMDTLEGVEFNTLLEFVSLINLLKGSRTGLELVLKLLGFDSIIREWWEQDPKHEVYTFEIVVIMDSNNVPDAVATLERVKTFARAYVFPLVENIDFRFSLEIGTLTAITAGFFKPHYYGVILERLP